MKRLIEAIVCGGIAVFAGTAAIEDNTSRDETGEITESGGVGVLAVRVGDCVQLPDEELIVSLEGVPCSTPHDAQLYAELNLRGEEFPGDMALEEQAFERCIAHWEPAVGTNWASDTVHDVVTLQPTAISWKVGDREAQCLIVRIDGDRIARDLLETTNDGHD